MNITRHPPAHEASPPPDAALVLLAHGPGCGEAIDAAGRDGRISGIVLLQTAQSGHSGEPPNGMPSLTIGLGITERRPTIDRIAMPQADGGLLLSADREAVIDEISAWVDRTFA